MVNVYFVKSSCVYGLQKDLNNYIRLFLKNSLHKNIHYAF
jgi:hypothetical protein